MLIALDAMGGDHGPAVTCPGALQSCRDHSDLEVVLVGQEEKIKPFIEKEPSSLRSRLHVVHTDEVVAMDEHPSRAIRSKRRSSLRMIMEMVRSKEVQGCVSAGNTGAIVAGGVLVVGRIRGIDRPGLGIVLPTLRPTLLLDAGATVRCKPLNLHQFAQMGAAYMNAQLGLEKPSVCLLSNGSEEIKGDDVINLARELLTADGSLNFKGYIEPNRVTFGDADVVVCDGFTGNIMLKSFEGVISFSAELVKEEMNNSFMAKLGLALCYGSLKRLKSRVDYQRYGGSPLLGVDGVVVKAHGRSKSTAITSALAVARQSVEQKMVDMIRYHTAKNEERVGNN